MAPTSARPLRHPRLLWLGVLCAVALVLVGGAILRRGAASLGSSASTAQRSGYVDPAECARCHEDVAATYRKTGMGRSLSKASTANAPEDFSHANSLEHGASGLRYTMLERDGELFERRSQSGPDGSQTNEMEERIDYVIGSGNHARSYLHRAANGQLIELPVSWYSESRGYWAMSPGYDWKYQKDFRRAITPECMFCHNGYPQGAMQSSGETADLDRSIFPANLPAGIDCQRCHGPGRAHVEAASAPKPDVSKVMASIVNPARLGRERQLEVCMQCHLETSRHEPNEQRLFDRTTFSYRPGEPMSDYKLYFSPAGSESDDGLEIAGAAVRLRKSACFRNSQMTCLTCHDPHDIPHGPEAAAHYVEACQRCHRDVKHTVALPAEKTCLTCHMPKRRTDDAVHVVMTDHFIRRTQPTRNLLAPLEETVTPEDAVLKVALYYPETVQPTPQAQIAVAEAQVKEHGAKSLEGVLERYPPDAPGPLLALAREYEREGNEAEVVRWSRRALDKRKNYEPAIVELAQALFVMHQDAEGTKSLEEGVGQYPEDDVLLTDLGNAYLRAGETERAAEMLTRSVNANPDRPETHDLLGVIATGKGDENAAEHEFHEALRCQPDDAEANDDLGNLLLQRGAYKDAEFYFEKAIDADPEFARAHHHLGRLLVLMDQLPRAVLELKKAAGESAADFQTHEDLADVLAVSGHVSESVAEYNRVLALRPNQPQAQLGLGIAWLAQHRPDEARTHLEAAAQGSDAETAQRARGLLTQIPH